MCDKNCKCEEYGEHIADLRNKFGMIYTYFQIKEAIASGNKSEGFAELLAEYEELMPDKIEMFVALLKQDIKPKTTKEVFGEMVD